jgi:uncharacterized protein (DUF58 family)
MPTLRLFLLLLLAAPLAAFGGIFAVAAAATVLLLALAATVDWWLARDGARVHLARILPSDKLSLGAWNPVTIDVANHTTRSQQIYVRDVPPTQFDLDPTPTLFTATLPPGAKQHLRYRVRPRERGDASFEDLHLRVDGPLHLVRRTWRCAQTAQAVRVYPGLRDLRRYDLLMRRGLEARPGAQRVRRPGASTEFERVRDYVPDDEFRRINWKATARRGQPMVNQFESERSQNLVVLLDAGRSMAALAEAPPDHTDDDNAGPVLTKLDFALNSALVLAYVASQRGDRVALLAYADDVRAFVPPQRGRRALLATVQALYALRAEPVEPNHGRALEFLAQRNLRRSLVVLFTDLADRESSTTLAAHLVRAARQHLVVCVTLGDPNVRRPAFALPRTTAALYEKMVAQQLLDDRAQVIATLAAHGVLTLDTDADTLSPRLIATYLDLKQRGRI